ncbi:hypothetical protein EUTSA_v10013966mg [Eutrema salsugineum]|uniref:SGNH hydrolase-type esterase domain-containing protein n=1 Tax=Eutrema salsugineum TaxID=72664 RepID=V4N4G6_EUTSA|nr:GDSL esterase/lipase At5g03610 [Eutrema salsugineum]ESQ40266.1 hypothetical protein EUTSA_v10013966mg [Eutrema salsugineum]
MDPLIKPFFSLLLFFSSTLLFGEINGVEGSNQHHQYHDHLYGPKKLFVFGDSYADTGNIKKSHAVSWRVPYGITFPGKPSGRFSDGRVSTDFLARLMRIKSPIPYLWKDYAGNKRLRYGMNFAYGGTGVFNTQSSSPNMTIQINLFEHLLGDDLYSPSDLSSSLALVSVAGNDYSNYLTLSRSIAELPAFIKQVVDQTEVNLRRIHAFGVEKIAVPSLQPLGCLPLYASLQGCNDTFNALVNYHNTLLQQVVAKLNNETNHSTFIIFDFYNAFLTIFKTKGENSGGSRRFETPLKPCCEGSCAHVDDKGEKKYRLCDDPKSAFFWDGLHPTQQGWESVYSVLGKNLTASLIKP